MAKPKPSVKGRVVAPPVATRIPHEVTAHGETRVDDYYWLREKDNPAVIKYLAEENDYTDAVLDHTQSLQKKLYDEMLRRIREADSTVPRQIDDYYYYSRTEEGKQYEVHCRRKGSMDASEEVILDENALAEGYSYFAIGAFAVSPCHHLLAYSIDTSGDEVFTLRVKNLDTGEILGDEFENTYYDVAWANDNKTLFYTTLDDAMRPHKLWRHELGSRSSDLVYEEEDKAFFMAVDKTKSRKFVTMSCASNTTTEVYFLDADEPGGEFELIRRRQREVEYHVAHHTDVFYVLTNEGAKNFKVMKVPTSDPRGADWDDVIPHRASVKIDDIDIFSGHLVVFERENGVKHIRIVELDSGETHRVDFPERVYTFWGGESPQFDTELLRFNYTSLIVPTTVYDYNMRTRESVVKKRYEVLDGYDPEDYESERVFASAHDGTKIPISLVYRRGFKRDGKAPLLLYGYGSYGANIEPHFASNRVSLLDRGFVFAIAHVRGGGMMGRQWYDRGKLLNKRNTFTDFIACAEYLAKERYSSPGNMVAQGGSAGGLLMGAVVNMRPDLWGAVLANVPFVDVVTTMLDPTMPLTVIEYEEWGDPRDKKYYEYMRSYSPYDNVEGQDYPNMLVTAGLNDPRVAYFEPAKWVAKLRRFRTDNNSMLLKTKMGEGHGGASGRYDYLREVALEYAFFLDSLGITD